MSNIRLKSISESGKLNTSGTVMKKILLTILTTALFATPVFAEPYVSVSTGLGYVANSNVTASGVTTNDFITYKSIPYLSVL